MGIKGPILDSRSLVLVRPAGPHANCPHLQKARHAALLIGCVAGVPGAATMWAGPVRRDCALPQVDPAKIVWTPYNAEREYANYRN